MNQHNVGFTPPYQRCTAACDHQMGAKASLSMSFTISKRKIYCAKQKQKWNCCSPRHLMPHQPVFMHCPQPPLTQPELNSTPSCSSTTKASWNQINTEGSVQSPLPPMNRTVQKLHKNKSILKNHPQPTEQMVPEEHILHSTQSKHSLSTTGQKILE